MSVHIYMPKVLRTLCCCVCARVVCVYVCVCFNFNKTSKLRLLNFLIKISVIRIVLVFLNY